MKNSLLILLVSSCLIFAGCSKQKWLSQDELFEKKKECLSYKNAIENAITQTLSERILQRDDYTHTEYLDEIFFSPAKNSCLYSVSITEIQSWNNCTFHKIRDFFSVNQVEIWTYLELIKDESWFMTDKCDFWASEEKYQKVLKELKWE